MLKVEVKNGDVVRFIGGIGEFGVGDIAICMDSKEGKYLGIYGSSMLRICRTRQGVQLIRQHDLHLIPELSTLRALHKRRLVEPLVASKAVKRSDSELCGQVVQFVAGSGKFSSEDYAICLNGDSRLYLGLSGAEFMQVWYDYGSVELVDMHSGRFVRTMMKTRISIAHTTKLFRKAYAGLLARDTVVI